VVPVGEAGLVPEEGERGAVTPEGEVPHPALGGTGRRSGEGGGSALGMMRERRGGGGVHPNPIGHGAVGGYSRHPCENSADAKKICRRWQPIGSR